MYLVEYSVVARNSVRAFGCKVWVVEESEDAETIVDRHEHHILCGPFLSVELGFGAPSFAASASMNPQCHRQFLVGLSCCFGPYVEVEAVFAVRRFVAISPFSCISAPVVECLIARMSEAVA